jgi:branched-chain amino acid transport system permease protein
VTAAVRPLGAARSRWLATALAVVLVGVLVPAVGSSASTFFWTTVAITALYAMSVNLLIGFAGIPTFGQAAYFGIGAYAVGLLEPAGIPMLPALALAALAAAAGALAVAAVSLRASGLAFSMITLAVAQGLYVLTFHLDVLGGENGLVGIFPGTLLGIDLARNGTALWAFCFIIVVAGIALLRVLSVSPFGRTLRMIRDDARRAEFLGIPVRRYQAAAFAVAGGIGGLSGALFTYVQGVTVPDYLFWTRSGDPIVMSIIGGMHTFLGPVLGTVVYMWTVDALSKLTVGWVLWVGLAFLVIVLAAPGGILGLPEQVRQLLVRWHEGRSPSPGGGA